MGELANPVLDLLFPPLCLLCKAKSRPLICTTCLDLLTPIDPAHRCRHCFCEIENAHGFCKQCISSPLISTPRAQLFEPTHIAWRLRSRLERGERERALYTLIASLLIMEWHRLDWPTPERIAIVPQYGGGAALRDIGEIFSGMLDQKLTHEFCLRWSKPFEWGIQRKKKDLLEGQNLLLLDLGSSLSSLQQAVRELWPAFPKEVYILSLFEV